MLLCMLILGSIGCDAEECATTVSDFPITTTTTTPSDILGPFYLANAPSTDHVGPEEQLADPMERLELKGRIFQTNNGD